MTEKGIEKFGAYFIGGANLLLFIPISIHLIYLRGGTWGFGLFFFLITIPAHLFLINAYLTLIKKWQHWMLSSFNVIGFIWCLVWVFLFAKPFYLSLIG